MDKRVRKQKERARRNDLKLTEEIAGALREKVLSGGNLFPRTGHITLAAYAENGEEALINLSCNTLRSWMSRGNTLPDGTSLKDYLGRAKEEYRTTQEQEKRQKMLDEAEGAMDRAFRIKTRVVVRDRKGKAMHNPETGRVLWREDPQLLSAQMELVRYALERLAPERYAKVVRCEHGLVFSPKRRYR